MTLSKSKFLEVVYKWGQTGYDGNSAETRISFIYRHLEDMPPWTWDTEHYEGAANKHMMGKFYVEDFENIKQIDSLVMQYHIHQEMMNRMKK